VIFLPSKFRASIPLLSLFLPDSLFILSHVVLTVLWEFGINLSRSIIFVFLIKMDIILD